MKKLFLLIASFGISSFVAQTPEISDADKKFSESAQTINLMELKVSQMAMDKGFSPAVKELAQNILVDNKKADDLLRKLAISKSVPVVNKLDDEQQKDYNKLSDKVGEDFDMSYTECMIKHNKKAAELYQTESKKGENTELRAFASNALPNINHHKNLAEETSKKLKKK